MEKWVVFYDSKDKELLSYTEKEEFAGEREETANLLSFEHGIPVQEIIVREEDR